MAVHVNTELLSTYWNIGKIIVEHEQSSKERADYGKQTLKQLSKDLTKEFGKGFSVSNLQFMRRFYQCYQIQQTVSVKLSWSHYCELLSISDTDKRSFYEKEAVNSGWSVRGFMFVGTRQRMEQKNRYIKNGRSSHIIIAAAPVFCRCRWFDMVRSRTPILREKGFRIAYASFVSVMPRKSSILQDNQLFFYK